MKKTLALILALSIVVIATACKKNPEKTDVTNPDKTPTQSQQGEGTDKPQTEPSENTDKPQTEAKTGPVVTVNLKTMNGDVTPKGENLPIFIKHLAKAEVLANDKADVDKANKVQTTLGTAYTRHDKEADELMNDMYSVLESGDITTERLSSQPWTLTTDMETKRNDEKVLSVTEELYYDAGGAHPSRANFGYNFDMTTGETVGIEAITGTDDESKQAFEAKVKEKIMAKYGEDAFIADYEIQGGSYAEAAKDSWYFTENGVTVVLNEYEIAPYAAGRFEIEFAKDELPTDSQKYFT